MPFSRLLTTKKGRIAEAATFAVHLLPTMK